MAGNLSACGVPPRPKQFVRDHIRNPGEFHTTPKASEMVQSFLLKLLWRYRQHVLPEGALPPPPAATPAVLPSARSNGRSKGSSSRVGSRELVDDAIRAHSFAFDQAGFLAAHARNTKLAVFLQQFRHSQMFEQFITERLQMAAEGFPPDDPFEQKVGFWGAVGSAGAGHAPGKVLCVGWASWLDGGCLQPKCRVWTVGCVHALLPSLPLTSFTLLTGNGSLSTFAAGGCQGGAAWRALGHQAGRCGAEHPGQGQAGRDAAQDSHHGEAEQQQPDGGNQGHRRQP